MATLRLSLLRPGRVCRSSPFLLFVVCAGLFAVALVYRVPGLLTRLPVKPFRQNDNPENQQEPGTTTAPKFVGVSQGILPNSEEDYNEDAITVTDSHPRLFGTQAKWNTRTSEIATDAYLSRWNTSVFERAAASYVQEPLAYPAKVPLDGNGALDVARELQQRIKHWAYAFRMSGDVRWRDRVWNELLVASGNSTEYFGEDGDNWHSEHWLDVGEFMVAFAYAYDWLYDAWTPEQREAVLWSIVSLGLNKGAEAYNSNAWFLSVRGNWNCVTNGGIIIGSLAVYHDDPTGVARELLPRAIENARTYCSQAVESDGTWKESPDYWYFGTQGHAQLTSALLTSTGKTYGMLTASPAFKDTPWFHIYNNGLTGRFNYGDCGPPKFTATANSLLFYGLAYANPSFVLYQRDRDDVVDPLSILWYEPAVEGSWHHDLPLDRDFPDENGAWVSMRSSWIDPDGLFVGMKAGRMTGHQTHGNLDAGDFVLDALGERWAGELCQDNYLAPEYFAGESQDSGRWGYYRCGSRGQNTIVFNNTNQLVDALPATSYATGASSCNRETDHGKADFGECNSSFWVADLSSVYTGGLSSFRRGLRLLGGRRGVLIQDELELVEEASEWRMHTNASISYSNGRRTAHLELNGKRLDVFIDAPSDLRFDNKSASGTVSNAQLPKGATDMPNPNVTVLSINIPAGNTTLAVRFLPQWVTREVGMDAVPPVLALQGWNLRSHTPSLGSR